MICSASFQIVLHVFYYLNIHVYYFFEVMTNMWIRKFIFKPM